MPSEETSRRWRPAGVVLKRTGNVSTVLPVHSAWIHHRQEDGPAHRPPDVLRLSKNPTPGANSPQPGDVFCVPARDFVIRAAILGSRPVFGFPDGGFAWMDRFLASRRLFFVPGRSSSVPGSLSFFPDGHLAIRSAIFASRAAIFGIRAAGLRSEAPSCFRRAHPARKAFGKWGISYLVSAALSIPTCA